MVRERNVTARQRKPGWCLKIAAVLTSLTLVAACAKDAGDTGSNGGEYYAGKTITITVPSSVGGGTDRAARLLAEFLHKKVPGEPEVNVENIEAASPPTVINDWYNRAPDDGTQIMMTSTSGHIPWLLGDPIVEYDLSTMQLLWANGSGRALLVRSDTGVKSADDLRDPPSELIHGGGSPADAALLTVLGLEVLGITDDMKHVFGYGSNNDEVVAFQSGETNVAGWTTASVVAERQALIDDGTMIVAYTNGRSNDGSTNQKTDRDPLFPDTPTVEELYREWNGTDPSGPAWDAFLLSTSVASEAGHAAWLQPDAPAEAVEILRSTIADFTEDPEYIEKHEAELGAPVEPRVGDDLQSLSDSLSNVDEETLDWIREWLQTKWNVQS